jgi:hypothetical protein
MADPRLNSVHLDAPRRQEYRKAREALLNARGWQTLALENQGMLGTDLPRSDTIIQDENKAPVDCHFWLVDRDKVYPLKVGLNTIGRSPDNDVVLQDGFVSRRHCAILVHSQNGCEVHDTASKNGTFVNGYKIAGAMRLRSGDEIRMCDKQLVFLSKDEPNPAQRDPSTLLHQASP